MLIAWHMLRAWAMQSLLNDFCLFFHSCTHLSPSLVAYYINLILHHAWLFCASSLCTVHKRALCCENAFPLWWHYRTFYPSIIIWIILITFGLYSVLHKHTCKRAVACSTVKIKIVHPEETKTARPADSHKAQMVDVRLYERMNIIVVLLPYCPLIFLLLSHCFTLPIRFIYKWYYLFQVIWFKTKQIQKPGRQLLLNGDLYSACRSSHQVSTALAPETRGLLGVQGSRIQGRRPKSFPCSLIPIHKQWAPYTVNTT